MHELAYFHSVSKDLEGNLIVSFKIEDKPNILEKLNKLKDLLLILDLKIFKKHRSLDANAYFWQLCDKIGKSIGNDKDTVYLMMLQGAGVFLDVEIPPEGYEKLERSYRLCETLYEFLDPIETIYGIQYQEKMKVRCYLGSHTYDSQEMADLISYTVNTANDLGIDTATPEEVERMVALYDQLYGKAKLITDKRTNY